MKLTICNAGHMLALGLLAMSASRAHAQPAHAERIAFALVIGNNHSLGARRPDLHYADDDAAKYFAILQTIAPERVTLLADLDADTSRLFPEANVHARSPTRAAVLRAGHELAAQLRAAAARGLQSDLYFIFAGHGDIDHGTGFIELADARFSAQDLEAWLREAGAARSHVILDSCNSFFMLGARRPGGRYYATPADAVRALSERLPNVGVFLSTSAEGEAFEWSEIQSGVFSHVVRSGLLGAADANGDGSVDYIELAAFVATATADVANPNLRPHVFARGPGGHDELPIVALENRKGARVLQLAEPRGARVRLRNRDRVPLLDAHTEPGRHFQLQIPTAWTLGAEIERSVRAASGEVTEQLTVPREPEELVLATLPSAAIRGSTRGPDAIFHKLFAQPFGPKAMAAYRAQRASAPRAVFGVSRESAERMNLLLEQIAGAERGRRLLSGSFSLALSAYYATFGTSMFALRNRLAPGLEPKGAVLVGGVMLGASALSLAYGAFTLLRPWNAERLYENYRAALATGDYAAAFALANDRLSEVAASERRSRWVGGVAAGLITVGSGAAWIYAEATASDSQARVTARIFGGVGVLLGVSLIGRLLFLQSPIEHLLKVWSRDTGQLQLEPAVVPLPDGAALSVSGRF